MNSSSTFDPQPLTQNSAQAMAVPNARAALVVAHPSHELRVHGWLETARPLVFVLTDGSGRSGKSRLDWTTQVLERAGVERGRVYGRLTDLEEYVAGDRRQAVNDLPKLKCRYAAEQLRSSKSQFTSE
ncbi:MAG: hypothetical protein AB7U82_08465 [Blastocatellales bacterium]